MITKEMIGLPIQKYRPKVDNSHNKTSRQKAIEIYNYIASRPAYIRRSGSTYRSEENDKTYIDLIEERVEKNEPIEIFFLGYCSKYTNEDLKKVEHNIVEYIMNHSSKDIQNLQSKYQSIFRTIDVK